MKQLKKIAAAVLIAAMLGLLLPQLGVNAEALKRGSRGDLVRQLQTRLRSWGYYSGTVDGVYGAKTESAVRAFQKAERADGGRNCGAENGGSTGLGSAFVNGRRFGRILKRKPLFACAPCSRRSKRGTIQGKSRGCGGCAEPRSQCIVSEHDCGRYLPKRCV